MRIYLLWAEPMVQYGLLAFTNGFGKQHHIVNGAGDLETLCWDVVSYGRQFIHPPSPFVSSYWVAMYLKNAVA